MDSKGRITFYYWNQALFITISLKGTTIKTKTITAFEDRIYAFQEFPGTFLYCYSTLMYVYIMDIDDKRPIVRWRHMMRDGPPTCLLVDRLKDNECKMMQFCINIDANE